MFKIFIKVTALAVLLGGFLLVAINWDRIRGLLPAVAPPPADIADVVDDFNRPGSNTTDFPLSLPAGFEIEIFARGLPGVRVIVRDGEGDFWISQTSEGVVAKLLASPDGVVRREAFTGLRNPHGLAFDPQNPNILYVAEEHQISRADVSLHQPALQPIASLPTQGGGHFTRTIAFGPDGRLYVSIGSSCNVCNESDPRRAAIYTMNPDGGDFRPFATGLRNTVFFDWSYVDGRLWGTDMGRDLLGDDLPPDEINIIEENGDYGWPICYGGNVHDSSFDRNQYLRDPCAGKQPAQVDLPAHSAPLGLAFVPEEGWPEDYWYDLIVAYHGSWNRTEPTGYKLVRIRLDESGNYQGTEDFVSGWLTPQGALGRPVDVLIYPGGEMYVTDDRAGVIYRIARTETD